VGSITTTGDIVTFPLPEPTSPAGIAAAADGTLWVTRELDPARRPAHAGGEVDPLVLPDDSDGVSLAAGPDGAMYFTSRAGISSGARARPWSPSTCS
jgi:virginiamycin B lyase